MQKYRYYLILLLWFLINTVDPVKGQELTLVQVIERVREVSSELQRLQNQVKAKEGAHIQAGAVPNPEIGGTGGNEIQMLEIGQEIEYPGKRKARENQAGEEVQIAALELRQAQIEIAARVAALFFDILGTDKNVELLQENLMVMEKFLQAAREKFNQGFGSKLDVIKGQVEQLRAKRVLLTARQELLTKKQDLKLLLKLESGDQFTLRGMIEQSLFEPGSNPDSLLSLAYKNHPALQAKEHALIASQFGLQYARLSSKPNFNLNLAGGREQNENRIELGLSIPLTLWDNKEGAKSEALFIEKSAENDVENTHLQITRKVIANYQKFKTALETVHLFQDSILDEARAVADSARHAFESGPFRFLDLIDAQQTYLDAALEYNANLLELRLAEIELITSIGIPFPGGLK